MDYILNKIDLKLQMFKNKNEKLSLINLYRSKFMYIITLYLAIAYSRNPERFASSKKEILGILRHPSEGSLLYLIGQLQSDLLSKRESKERRGIYDILDNYVSIRNRDFGHDFSCDPKDHSNLIAKFENLAKELSVHRYPYISNDLYLININVANGNSYEGSCYNPNGGMSFWEQNTKENLKLNELYVTTNPNDPRNFIRVSPFIFFDGITDDIYLFRQLDNEKSGLVSYIKLFQQNPNGYKQTWEEFALRDGGDSSPKMKDVLAQETMNDEELSKEDKDFLQKQFHLLFDIKSGLLVIGDRCKGKSTVINSIFNTDVAKINVTPERRFGITEYEIENLSVWEANIDQIEDLEKLFAENSIDVVLFVTSAITAFNSDEVNFIKSFLLPKLGTLDKVVFAMNHMDFVFGNDIDIQSKYLCERALKDLGEKITPIPFSIRKPLFSSEINDSSFKIIVELLAKVPEEKKPAYEGVFNKAIATNKKDVDAIQSFIWNSVLKNSDSFNKIYTQIKATHKNTGEFTDTSTIQPPSYDDSSSFISINKNQGYFKKNKDGLFVDFLKKYLKNN